MFHIIQTIISKKIEVEMRMPITIDNEYKTILVTRKYLGILDFSPQYLVSLIKHFNTVQDDVELCSI